jgi:hypothetical protein
MEDKIIKPALLTRNEASKGKAWGHTLICDLSCLYVLLIRPLLAISERVMFTLRLTEE